MKTRLFFFLIILNMLFVMLPAFAQPDVPGYTMTLTAQPEKGIIKGDFQILIPGGSKILKQDFIYLSLMMNSYEKPDPEVFMLLQENGPRGRPVGQSLITDLKLNNKDAKWNYTKPQRPVMQTFSDEHFLCQISTNGLDASADTVLSFSYSCQFPNKKGMDDFYFDEYMISRFSWFPYLMDAGDPLTSGEFTLPFFKFKAAIDVTPGWDMAAQAGYYEKSGENHFEIESVNPVCSFPVIFLKGFSIFKKEIQDKEKILRIYYKPGSEPSARLTASYSEEVLQYYRNLYFPLDTNNISMVQGTPGLFGMAADSIVILGDGGFSGLNRVMPDVITPGFDFLISHEIGHFYFGIGSPPDFARENYLSEGVNEYSTIKYIESKYGIWKNFFNKDHPDLTAQLLIILLDILQGDSQRKMKYNRVVNAYRNNWDTPLSAEPEQKIQNSASQTDYDRSYFIFNSLAAYLGEDQFDSALLNYLQENRYRQTNSRILEESLSGFYKKDIKPFFNDFVYGNQTLDYVLNGTINKKNGAEYNSVLNITLKNNYNLFVPVGLTLVFEDNTREVSIITKQGQVSFTTSKKIRTAVLDIDSALIEYDRKNNYLPRQFSLDLFPPDEVKNKGSMYWGLSMYMMAEDDSSIYGLGLSVYDPTDWAVSAVPLAGIPKDTNASMAFGGYLSAAIKPDNTATGAVDARIMQTGTAINIDFIQASLNKIFYFDTPYGIVSKFYLPLLTLATSAGIADLGLQETGSTYLFNKTSLAFDYTTKTGSYAIVSNELDYYLDNRVQDQVSITIGQGLSIIPRVLLGVKLSGSAIAGEVISKQADNAVSGLANSGPDGLRYKAGAKAFLGIPMLNNIDIPVFNAVVIQSVNLGFFYDGAFSFSGFDTIGTDLSANYQHAAGIELLTVTRTLADIGIGVGAGFSFNLNKITDQPGNINNYIPTFFLETDILPNLYISAVSY